ncbi:MAG: hypothetical protein LKJ76_09440 [Lachnospiraceae bacterium]|nr:hypothetical protein [Lachnospiraceae bacterium]
MLYVGEGNNKILLIRNGKIIWTYSTGSGWEYDDIWMMSNGNILFSRQTWAGEVTPDKKIVWKTEAGPYEEIHTLQPIGIDKVLILVNGMPPRLMILNKHSGKIEMEHELPYDADAGVHAQFRRVRMTNKHTILVPFLLQDRVVEYDMDFHEIWAYGIPSPWAAVRLQNGNTLITDEKEKLTREVDRNRNTVWEIRLDELPEPYRLFDSQSCVRLGNGNTVLCSRGNNGESPQLVEVDRDKNVVWAINDWKNLGPCTAIQILTDGGIPEEPGSCER